MEWVKVTKDLLSDQPDWLYRPLWVAHKQMVYSGMYDWRQGRTPDRFYCEDGRDISALDDCYIMPLIKPVSPQ